MSATDVPGYEALRQAFDGAYDRAARGKGKERHANSLPFHEQPICTEAAALGLGGHVYQIRKKARELLGMIRRGETEKALGELRDIMVYAAAGVHVLASKPLDPTLYQVPSTPPTQEMIEDQKGWLELLNEGSEKVFQSPYLPNPGSAPETAAGPVNYVLCPHGRIGRCEKCEPPTRHRLFPSPTAELTCQACNHYWDDHGPRTAGCAQHDCPCMRMPPPLAPGLGD